MVAVVVLPSSPARKVRIGFFRNMTVKPVQAKTTRMRMTCHPFFTFQRDLSFSIQEAMKKRVPVSGWPGCRAGSKYFYSRVISFR